MSSQLATIHPQDQPHYETRTLEQRHFQCDVLLKIIDEIKKQDGNVTAPPCRCYPSNVKCRLWVKIFTVIAYGVLNKLSDV